MNFFREKQWKIFETTRAAKRAAKVLEKDNSFLALRMAVKESPSLLQRKASDASSQVADNISVCSDRSDTPSQTSSVHLPAMQPNEQSFDSVGYDMDCLYR